MSTLDKDSRAASDRARAASDRAQAQEALQELQQLLANIPTTDPGDGVTVWKDNGVLKVTPA